MEMEILQAEQAARGRAQTGRGATQKAPTRTQVITRLAGMTKPVQLGAALALLAEYAGASHYLLIRCDLIQDPGLDFVVSSNWPFDLVRTISGVISNDYARSTELEKCMSLLQPNFALFPDEVDLPAETSRQYCTVNFNVGRTRLALMLIYVDGFILSPDRLRDVGLMTAYLRSFAEASVQKGERDCDLTEREIECLYWIAEGKTSDEIAVILGISRNTINNYITSVMRKTATKTRSEAIAYAVRNNLV
ncbi:transcriptional regulator VisN [Gellertiella hungarica]|uniref:DNA-binding CsgD family transcriptional regulator n=1 Tax=Gellertiella hungarica TaxID=1572859 RepID=A0A7W6NJ80_9HYPH|nr:helix-turn-helix transcriptional regulator [Gellertiella hungarica]MBB4064100.1 DNA-binding CsgD family transcriptional regulator [Gellertiella hungarica]